MNPPGPKQTARPEPVEGRACSWFDRLTTNGVFFVGVLFALAAVFVRGGVASPASSFNAPSGKSIVEGEGWPRILVDPWGARTAIPAPCRRVLSTSLMTDEIVLTLLPPERIAGVGPFSVDPACSNAVEEAKLVPRTPHAMSVERILALSPDLVLAARFNREEQTRMLVACGVPVARIDRYESLSDIRDNILLVGRLTGEETRAGDLARQVDETVESVKRRVSDAPDRPRVLYWLDGGWTFGGGTLVDEFIGLAGAVNVAAGNYIDGLAPIPLEAAIAADPEVILVVRMDADLAVRPSADALKALGGDLWQGVSAVRNGRVYEIPARHIESVSHHVAKALEDFARAIHPECYADDSERTTE